MSNQCAKDCPFLEYSEKESTPSEYLGEGYYVHYCKRREPKEYLQHYLEHPLRTDKCMGE